MIEVAAWTFVPVAGAIMADMGAEVIKVEPPAGDPQRGLQNLLNTDTKGAKPFTEIPNRGKRSITLDLRNDAGHEVLIMWALAPDIVSAPYVQAPAIPDRRKPGNPITNWYRTSDDRWIYFVCLQGDRFWAEFCTVIERPDLIEDPRYVDELDAVFASRTLEEWKERFAGFSGVWAPALRFKELHEHAQVAANGYLPELTSNEGVDFRLVSSAMHVDEVPTAPAGPAPERDRAGYRAPADGIGLRVGRDRGAPESRRTAMCCSSRTPRSCPPRTDGAPTNIAMLLQMAAEACPDRHALTSARCASCPDVRQPRGLDSR